ncbi:DExH-box splicing factor binding site-domain-containing protein [Blakeslea trispora]|nr:DExH-box splicing factor binding site-domain-containing protein [Blakeslea trispora]
MSSRLPLQSRAHRPKFENKRAIFGDEDDDEERVRDERVLGIEDNQIKEAEPKQEIKPLSISPLPNTDWRTTTKQNKERFLPTRQPQTEASKPEILDQSNALFGLQIQKKTVSETANSEKTFEEAITTTTTTMTIATEPPVEKTLEERAVDAILKESLGQADEDKDDGPKKVIAMDEAAVFRNDVVNRPDETTMEDYENIPVEEFGAALLRGLGWNEGEGIGRNRKNSPAPPPPPVKQREALLGLGAKPEESEGQSQREKAKHKRAAYEYKDTSLFKKISKRKIDDALDDQNGSRASSRSSHKRYDDDDNNHRRYSDRDDRHSSSSSSKRRRRSRSTDCSSSNSSRRSHSSSSSRRHRSRSRDSSRHKSSRRRD